MSPKRVFRSPLSSCFRRTIAPRYSGSPIITIPSPTMPRSRECSGTVTSYLYTSSSFHCDRRMWIALPVKPIGISASKYAGSTTLFPRWNPTYYEFARNVIHRSLSLLLLLLSYIFLSPSAKRYVVDESDPLQLCRERCDAYACACAWLVCVCVCICICVTE